MFRNFSQSRWMLLGIDEPTLPASRLGQNLFLMGQWLRWPERPIEFKQSLKSETGVES